MENVTTGESPTKQARTSVSYSEIVLTEEETNEALRVARRDKHFREKNAAYLRKLNESPVPIKLTKEMYIQILKDSYPGFNQELQKEQFNILLDYFMSDSEKGLILFGGVGCGKTTMMGIFMSNPKASYYMKSCREISALYTKGGFEAIQQFYVSQQFQRNYFGHESFGICFDDLGEEKNKKYFGNELNVMEDILESRYNSKHLWKSTHVTTNLTSEQIEEIYGSRVRSRMREMFEIVSFKDIGDQRK